MERRRTVLRRGLAAIGAAGIGTLAGCQEDLPTDGNDGGDGGDGDEPTGPSWAAWLPDPTTVGEVDVHGFATYDVAALLSYRDAVPSEIDEGVNQLFGELDSLAAEDIDRLVGGGFGRLPDDPSATGSQPVGWTGVATGSFETDALVSRLSETDAYAEAGEYEGFSLFEGPSEEGSMSAAVGVGSEAVVGGGAYEYDLGATAAVERAIDAEAGAVDRYYGSHESVADLIDRHGSGTTAMGAVDPEGTFGALVEEQETQMGQYEDLIVTARGVGRSTTLGEGTTEAQVSMLFEDADEEVVEDVRSAVEVAQAQRNDPEGPFSDPSVSLDGDAVVLSASADTDAALSSATGLAFVAPEAAVVGAFSLSVGGGQRQPVAPQVAWGWTDDPAANAVELVHEGGDTVDDPGAVSVVVDSRVQGTLADPAFFGGGIRAGDSATLTASNAGLRADDRGWIQLVWESREGDSSALLSEHEYDLS